MSGVVVTMADFEIKHYHEYIVPLIKSCKIKGCTYYCIAIRQLLEEDIEDTVKKDILTLFYCVFSYLLKAESPKEPFNPRTETATPSNLTQKQKQFLESILPEIGDSEAKARVADVLWTLGYGKRHKHAETAIEAYILSAERLLQLPYEIPAAERVERAFRIAKQLNGRNSKYDDVREKIEYYIETQKDDAPFFVKHLINFLFEEKEEDGEKYLSILEDIAKKRAREKKFFRLDEFWYLAAKLYQKINNKDKAKYCQIQAAETYVAMANIGEQSGSPSSILISHHLQEAVNRYKRLGKSERFNELYKRLLEAQSKTPSEMKSVSFSMDISEEIKAKEHVSGCNTREALLRFAFLMPLLSFEEVKKSVEGLETEFPLTSLFPCTYYDAVGRVQSISSSDDPIEVKMHRHVAQVLRPLAAQFFNQALQQMRSEHSIPLSQWVSFIEGSPFVPPDCVNVYAHGLSLGFNGDFLTAAHILIPQMENSIRHILNVHNIPTSKQTSSGTQEEKSLNVILNCSELEAILERDLIFDLKGLLIKKEGSNLRNDLMHGLLSDDQLSSSDMVYLYWLALRMALAHFFIERK